VDVLELVIVDFAEAQTTKHNGEVLSGRVFFVMYIVLLLSFKVPVAP